MLRQGLRVGVMAAIAALPVSAHAELSGLVSANVAEGATTNALNAPDGPAVVGDAFTTLRASLAGNYHGPRQDQTLSYIYAANIFAEHSEGDSQTHELTWTIDALPTGRTEIQAQASGTYGSLTSVNPIAAATALSLPVGGAGQLMATPSGPVTFFDVAASATGSFRPRPSLLWREMTTVNDLQPIHGDLAHTSAFIQEFRRERQWARDTFTLDLSFNYLHAYPFTASTGVMLPTIETLLGQLLAGWRRDVRPDFSFSLEGGVLVLASLVDDNVLFGPAGRAIAHYQYEFALAELMLEHAPDPNVYLGQMLVSDAATLRALLPLDRKQRFHFVALGIAERSSVLSTNGLDAAIDLLAVDAGITFQTIGYPFLASLDYIAQDQTGHTVATTTGSEVFPSLHRQMVMLTLTASWGSNTFWGGGSAKIGGKAGASGAASSSSVEPGSLGGPSDLVGSSGAH
jgi:hypothetical protein